MQLNMLYAMTGKNCAIPVLHRDQIQAKENGIRQPAATSGNVYSLNRRAVRCHSAGNQEIKVIELIF